MISHAYVRMTPALDDRAAVRAQIVTHDGDRTGTPLLGWANEARRFDLTHHAWVAGPADATEVLALVDQEPIVWVEGGKLHVGFDWWSFEEHVLLERSLPATQPTYSKGRVPYTRIPFGVRAQLNRLRIAVLRTRADDPLFPATPVETGVDALRELIWKAACRLAGVQPVLTRERELVLTHDLDEASGWPGVAQLRQVERPLGVASAFGVLSERYRLAEGDLQQLIDEGCEVFSHGYLHDGTLAFLPAEELRRRLRHFFEAYPSMRGQVRGFRSGQLVRSPSMFQEVADFFDYDMTPPNVELGGPHGWRTGCATTMPFTDAHGLSHLPLTLPQDYFLSFIDGLRPAQVTEAWLAATEQVWAVGGVAVHLVHPDNVVRRPRLLGAYRDYLVEALDRGASVRLPGEVMTSLGVSR